MLGWELERRDGHGIMRLITGDMGRLEVSALRARNYILVGIRWACLSGSGFGQPGLGFFLFDGITHILKLVVVHVHT